MLGLGMFAYFMASIFRFFRTASSAPNPSSQEAPPIPSANLTKALFDAKWQGTKAGCIDVDNKFHYYGNGQHITMTVFPDSNRVYTIPGHSVFPPGTGFIVHKIKGATDASRLRLFMQCNNGKIEWVIDPAAPPVILNIPYFLFLENIVLTVKSDSAFYGPITVEYALMDSTTAQALQKSVGNNGKLVLLK